MVEHCVVATPRSTQKRTSKLPFQLTLVVSVINTLWRGHRIELMGIFFAN